MTIHDGKFVINDILLEISPEAIVIDRSSHLKQYSPLRTKGTAKVRSNQSTISITLQTKFNGIDKINSQLRPLVAQFLLTPFCYVDNQYLRDALLGTTDKGENIALALQNLTISTIEGHPETWNVVFSFIYFNYKPYSKDFKFKSSTFQANEQLTQGTPGKPFQTFYRNQMNKLKPVSLTTSNLNLSVLQFMLADKPPENIAAGQSVEIDINKLRDFELSTETFIKLTDQVFQDLGTDSLDSSADRQLIANASTLEDPVQRVNVISNIVDRLSVALKTNRPNDTRLKELLAAKNQIIQDAAQVFKGLVWLEYPSSESKNAFGNSRLYYRSKDLKTLSGDMASGIVATSITMNFNHKLVSIPMQGHQYPTMQHLGSSDVSFAVQFAVLDDEAHKEFADFWNISQNNLQYGKFIPQELTTVRADNELFKFLGVENVLLQEAREQTVEGNPGLYQYQISFVENTFKVFDVEQIQAIPTSFREVRKLVWKAIWDNITFITFKDKLTAMYVKAGADAASAQFLNNKIKTTLDVAGFAGPSAIAATTGTATFGFIGTVLGAVGGSAIGASAQDVGLRNNSNRLLAKIDSQSKTTLLSETTPRDTVSLIASLTDDQVLGIEGFSNITNEIAANQEKPVIIVRDDLAKNNKTLNDRLVILRSIRDRVKRVLAQENEDVHINGNTFVFSDGTSINVRELFPDFTLFPRGGENLIGNELISGKAGATRSRKLLSGFALQVELELAKLESLESQGIVRDPFFDLFRAWNLYTVTVADEIIDKYLDLPIFLQAKKLHAQQTKGSRRTLYADMDFGNITNAIRQEFGVQEIPDLEPDFYFWNESIDAGVPVQASDIQSIKDRTLSYVNAVDGQNTQWYQNLYMKKTNQGMVEFLKEANRVGQPIPLDFSIQGEPGLSEINSDIDVSGRSINATLKGLDTSKAGFQATTNRPGMLGPSTQTVDKIRLQAQSIDAASGLNGLVSANLTSNVIKANYGAWIHPLPGASITSTPGYRTLSGGSFKFHEGTDLAYPKIGGTDQTTGKPVHATLTGKIISMPETPGKGYGRAIFIASPDSVHGSIIHTYGHLSGFAKNGHGRDWQKGDIVNADDVIGFAGNEGIGTGPHLHFQVETSDGKIIIYPFGDALESRIITAGNGLTPRTVIITNSIASNSAVSAAYLPGAGLAGISAGLTALDMSIQQLETDWSKGAGYRMNRAYPSFYLAFIEEDLDDKFIYKFDDYFSFASVVSMYCVKDRKVPADYVMMELTNIAGGLSNRRFSGTFNEQNPVFKGKEAREANGLRDPNLVDTQDEFKFESMLLREGVKVEIRLGYSNYPDKLDIVFIGRISSVQFSESDDVVQLELQSLATELVQDLKGSSQVETLDGIFVSDARTGPLLETMISSPECVSFGFWKRGSADVNENRDLLTDRWTWQPEPSSDNIFAPPSSFLDPRKMTLGKGFFSKLGTAGVLASGTVAGAAAAPAVAAAGGAAVLTLAASSIAILNLPLIAAAAATGAFSGTVNSNSIPTNIGLFTSLAYYLYQTTIWDVFKEMEHRHPDCISSPVPYVEKLGGRTRMTMFFGNPDWLYFARDPAGSENSKSQEIKDRAEELKRVIKNKSAEERFNLMTDFANATETTNQDDAFRQKILNKVNGMDVNESVDDEIDRLVEDARLKEAISQRSIQTFRRYHVLTSAQHIIANNIRAKSSNTYNAISINYASGDSAIDTDSDGPHIDDVEELTMKLDPLIPDEYVREGVFTYPNCQGDEMAKRYAISHLQKSCWDIYQGDIVILGNPAIKPYDVCFIYDDYTDMYGAVQVQRIVHFFDEQNGFISVITPDLITTATEGTSLTQFHAMGLVAERFLGLENVVTPRDNPFTGNQINPWKLALANGIMGLASFFGAKKLLFMTQFGHPIRVHPLVYQGQALVAGFGPPGVRENEFFITDAYEWVITRKEAVSNSITDFGRMFKNRQGLLNTRGSIFGGTKINNVGG